MKILSSLAITSRKWFAYSCKNGSAKCILGLFLLLFPTAAGATYTRCDNCTANQAEASAILDYHGDGLYYVLDIPQVVIHAYEVTMESTSGFDSPLELGGDVFAIPVATSFTVQDTFDTAVKVRNELMAGLSVPADTLPRADSTGFINSASDVIGSVQDLGTVAGFLGGQTLNVVRAAATQIVNKATEDVAMKIRFDDGSTILVKPRLVITDDPDSLVEVILTYVPDSARLPDGAQLPDSTDDYDGLRGSMPSGPSFDAFDAVSRLFGVPIFLADGTRIGGGLGGGANCRAEISGTASEFQITVICSLN